MTLWSARIARNGKLLGERIARADSFWMRFLGLMGRRELRTGEGLLLSQTSSIHMGFMRFPIDVLFLDESGRIVAVRERVRPWIGWATASADAALELPAGTAFSVEASVGDLVEWSLTDMCQSGQ